MSVRKSKKRIITFKEALKEALVQSMRLHPETFIMGLGVTDPKGIFGTTLGLKEIFGSRRIFDMPVSENAMTGVAVGAAVSGLRPIMVHQRSDFMLMAMDQIINNAAKWRYMYGGQNHVPLTIRTIVGRGWGQGPQHSQNFKALFAHIPGLKVIAPTTPYEAKGLLVRSIQDNDPVIFIEHRWLYEQLGPVPGEIYSLSFGKAAVMRKGKDVTIVASSEMAVEAWHLAEKLKKIEIEVEVVNLRSIKPLDEITILNSIAKTGRLLVLDPGWLSFGISAEIAALVAEKGFNLLKTKIKRLGLPEAPSPSSPGLNKYFYPSEADMGRAVAELLDIKIDCDRLGICEFVSDVPGDYFTGPF